VRSYQRTLLGITLILVAAQILVSVRIPRPIGYIMVLAGLAYMAQGVVVGAEGFSSSGTVPGLLGFAFDLAWMIWLVIMAWQRPSAVKRLATAPMTAS
jgi:hydrogenase/urease accessory protein HupE